MDPELLDELERQHRMVEDLLEQLEQAEEADEQRPLVDQLTSALTEHMQIEETQVYPELARLDPEMSEEAETEHTLARDGLQKMQQLVGKPGFGAAVAMVQAGIEHHVEEEEGEAFPKLREALGVETSGSGKSASSKGEGSSEGATKEELYERAKQAGIEGRSSMSKDELERALDQ